MPKRIDITGQLFGELEVIKLSDKRNNKNTRLWECKCHACGETTYVLGASLRSGHYKSCGCIRADKRDAGVREHVKRDSVDGTRITSLQAKLHKGNKSGHKGVRWNENRRKWTAHIGFQGKQIALGYFALKRDAISARRVAEEKYHKPYSEGENE